MSGREDTYQKRISPGLLFLKSESGLSFSASSTDLTALFFYRFHRFHRFFTGFSERSMNVSGFFPRIMMAPKISAIPAPKASGSGKSMPVMIQAADEAAATVSAYGICVLT